MSVSVHPHTFSHRHEPSLLGRSTAVRALAPLGRLLFAAIFILSSLSHFSAMTIAYAAKAGVPMANVLVPLSGIVALVGGLSVLVGYKARWGAALLVIFLVPVTLIMHKFWGVSDPMMQKMQLANFMKNVSMLGAALFLLYFGPGPVSVDERER